MTLVSCTSQDCAYRDKEGDCAKDFITVSDAAERGCNDFESYTSSADYKRKFWRALRNRETNAPCRNDSRGKRLELFGGVFYTEGDDRYPEDAPLTEERTGVYVGLLCDIHGADDVKKILDKLSLASDVMSLPIKEMVVATGD